MRLYVVDGAHHSCVVSLDNFGRDLPRLEGHEHAG